MKTLLLAGIALHDLLLGQEPKFERTIGIVSNTQAQANLAWKDAETQLKSLRKVSKGTKVFIYRISISEDHQPIGVNLLSEQRSSEIFINHRFTPCPIFRHRHTAAATANHHMPLFGGKRLKYSNSPEFIS